MRKTANQANKFPEAEREKPALERCCLAAEAGFDRLIGMTNYFLSKTSCLPAINGLILALLQYCKEKYFKTM